MTELPDRIDIVGVPPHVASWTVSKIPGFVSAVLKRWQHEHGLLPETFVMLMCPQAEINAMGGLPPKVVELTDPRLRCRHFTGCHRPYFVVFFTGADAEVRRAEIQPLLSWSEGYRVELTGEAIRLEYAGATEDAAPAKKPEGPRNRLRELIETGELVSILG